MRADPNPDEMMQLLKHIRTELDIHDKLVLTKSKVRDFLSKYEGEMDPDCPHDEVVVVARYKFAKKANDDDRVRTTSYCALCKLVMDRG